MFILRIDFIFISWFFMVAQMNICLIATIVNNLHVVILCQYLSLSLYKENCIGMERKRYRERKKERVRER